MSSQMSTGYFLFFYSKLAYLSQKNYYIISFFENNMFKAVTPATYYLVTIFNRMFHINFRLKHV